MTCFIWNEVTSKELKNMRPSQQSSLYALASCLMHLVMRLAGCLFSIAFVSQGLGSLIHSTTKTHLLSGSTANGNLAPCNFLSQMSAISPLYRPTMGLTQSLCRNTLATSYMLSDIAWTQDGSTYITLYTVFQLSIPFKLSIHPEQCICNYSTKTVSWNNDGICTRGVFCHLPIPGPD